MTKSIEEYLDQLKVELKDSDPATVQDALADAEEHLIDKLVRSCTMAEWPSENSS